MKKTLLFIIFNAIVSCIMAQVPLGISGAISHSPNCRGTGVLVRNYGVDRVLVHHVDADNGHIHHFALEGARIAGDCEMAVALGQVDATGDITYTVSDMRILGDTCYFCGHRTIDNGLPLYDIDGNIIATATQNDGMIGWFSIADMETGSVDVRTSVLSSIESLSRMAVRRGIRAPGIDCDIVVSAIGRQADGNRAFVAEACHYPSSGWQVTVSGANAGGNSEVFCDIASSENSTVIASMVPDDNEGSWVMNLHESLRGHYYSEYAQPSIPEALISYDFASVSGGWGWHSLNSEIRMCYSRGSSVAVAYASLNQANGSEGIIYVDFGGSSHPMLASSPRNAQVREIQYLSNPGRLGILLKNSRYYNGCLYSCPQLPPIPGIVEVFSKQSVKLQSLSHVGNSTYTAAGFNMLNSKVTNLWKNPLISLRPGCLEIDHEQADTLSWYTTDKVLFDWELLNGSGISWQISEGSVRRISQNLECMSFE